MKTNYHIAPEKGFLNDPNGLVQFRGVYHVFYQWLPVVQPQGAKHWRHCTSRDLIHWEDKGSALKPEEWYDKDGCYSGSALVHKDRIYLFYTGNVRDPQGNRQTYQCAAVSQDGEHFEKLGPVVYLPKGYTPHFRDPKVWKDEKKELFWMLVGAQTEEKKGNAALFSSRDLLHWEEKGRLLEEDRDWGYMCECPDMAIFPEDTFFIGSCQKKLLIEGRERDWCRAAVFPVKADLEQARCQVLEGEERLLDEGFDFYAPQSFVDEKGRRLMFGWLGAGELEYQMSQPTVKENWLHTLTIPRELFVRDRRLCQRPAEELKALRSREEKVKAEKGEILLDKGTHCMELLVKTLGEGTLWLDLCGQVSLAFDSEKKELKLRRKSWLREGFDEKICRLEHLSQAQIFLDGSVTEIFINEGAMTFALKTYFTEDTAIRLRTEGGAEVTFWNMEE